MEQPFNDKWKGNKNEGRKNYLPDSMLKLLVYGYPDQNWNKSESQ